MDLPAEGRGGQGVWTRVRSCEGDTELYRGISRGLMAGWLAESKGCGGPASCNVSGTVGRRRRGRGGSEDKNRVLRQSAQLGQRNTVADRRQKVNLCFLRSLTLLPPPTPRNRSFFLFPPSARRDSPIAPRRRGPPRGYVRAEIYAPKSRASGPEIVKYAGSQRHGS